MISSQFLLIPDAIDVAGGIGRKDGPGMNIQKRKYAPYNTMSFKSKTTYLAKIRLGFFFSLKKLVFAVFTFLLSHITISCVERGFISGRLSVAISF